MERRQCQNAVSAVRRAKHACCSALNTRTEPWSRPLAVLAKLGLAEGAAQLFRVPLLHAATHRGRRPISIHVDRVTCMCMERPTRFGHDALPPKVEELPRDAGVAMPVPPNA